MVWKTYIANLNLGYDVAKTTGRNFVNSNSDSKLTR